MTADGDPQARGRRADDEEVSATNPGRLRRLKQFFVGPYLRVIDAMSAVLKRLRSRVGATSGENGEREERAESRGNSAKRGLAPQHEGAPVAPPPAPRSVVRSLLINLLVFIVGIIAGMTFSFALLSNMVINQAQKIDDLRDELTQLEKQYSRVTQSEAKYRARLLEVETQLNQVSRTVTRDAGSAEANAAASVPEKPGTARNNCSAETGNAEKLARCVEEFNRKGSR